MRTIRSALHHNAWRWAAKGFCAVMACIVFAAIVVMNVGPTHKPLSQVVLSATQPATRANGAEATPKVAASAAQLAVYAHEVAASNAKYDSQVALVWQHSIAAHPREAQLSTGTMARVNQAMATKSMSATDRFQFVQSVQVAQVELQTGGMSQADHDGFVSALRRGGISPAMAEKLSHDPIALAVIPVSVKPTTVSGPTVRLLGQIKSGCTNTSPFLSEDITSHLGNRLATVSYIKSYCWQLYWPNYVSIARAKMTSVPQYRPPNYSPTGWCIGCEFFTDWHAEFWYPYNNAYIANTGNNAFAEGVDWHAKQCFGVWLFNQCFTLYASWTLNLHPDGTFFWQY